MSRLVTPMLLPDRINLVVPTDPLDLVLLLRKLQPLQAARRDLTFWLPGGESPAALQVASGVLYRAGWNGPEISFLSSEWTDQAVRERGDRKLEGLASAPAQGQVVFLDPRGTLLHRDDLHLRDWAPDLPQLAHQVFDLAIERELAPPRSRKRVLFLPASQDAASWLQLWRRLYRTLQDLDYEVVVAGTTRDTALLENLGYPAARKQCVGDVLRLMVEVDLVVGGDQSLALLAPLAGVRSVLIYRDHGLHERWCPDTVPCRGLVGHELNQEDFRRAVAAVEPTPPPVPHYGLQERPEPVRAPLPAAPRRPGERVRLGLVTPVLLHGGVERWLLDLLKGADPRLEWAGVAVTRETEVAPDTGAAVAEICPVTRGYRAAQQLYQEVDTLVYWGEPNWWREIARNRNQRVICVSHGSGPWTEKVFKGLPEWVEIVAVAQDALTPLPPEQQQRATVIRNGVDLARLQPTESRLSVKRRWGIPEESFVLGFVGRMAQEKRPVDWVRTLAHLPPHWYGVMIGEPYDRARIDQAAVAWRCQDRLRVLPYDPEIGSTLGALDTLLMLSEEEGYGLALVEAMAAGVPVVSTPVGILREYPELARIVPHDLDPFFTAGAILLNLHGHHNLEFRRKNAQEWAVEHAGIERFQREWNDYLARPRHL